MLKEFKSNSPEETSNIAQMLASKIEKGATLLLHGDLGAGKTMFSSGFVIGATGENHNVTSPTFTIVQEYDGKVKVNHFDLYRIGSLDELEMIGVYEYLFDTSAICLIEWPERVSGLESILKLVYDVNIEKIDEHTRNIRIQKIKG